MHAQIDRVRKYIEETRSDYGLLLGRTMIWFFTFLIFVTIVTGLMGITFLPTP